MERTSGSPEVKIGLVDGPVVTQHPDLAGEHLHEIGVGASASLRALYVSSGRCLGTVREPPRQVCLRRRAVGKCLPRIAPLMRGELRGAAHMDAALLGALAAFARARADQLPLKLGKPTQMPQLGAWSEIRKIPRTHA